LRNKNAELSDQNESLDNLRREMQFQTRVLTHDLRRPVSAAASCLEELRREIPVDVIGDSAILLTMAMNNLDRVEDMLQTLRQVEVEGHSGEPIAETDCGEVWKDLVVEFASELERRQVRVIVEKSVRFRCMMRKIRIVARNLLMNALRYVPVDGTGIVTLGAFDAGEEWHLRVSDNGPGIPPEYHSLIFEVFRKAPQEEPSPGLGVGLFLVSKIAEQHGGRAWVESDGISGSIFVLAIPKRISEYL
jgi:signal transduction histidine kinase